MKRHFVILLVMVIVVPVFAGSGSLLKAHADSIYQSLTPAQKLGKLIWLSGDEFEQTANTVKSSKYAGVYLHQPLPQAVGLNEVEVALEFNQHFDYQVIAPDLPGIEALSAVRDYTLLERYTSLIEARLRQLGYDYLVLPLVSDSTRHLKRVHAYFQSHNPRFFVSQSDFDFAPEPKKRDFLPSLANEERGIVLKMTDLQEYSKVLRKAERNVEDFRQSILRLLIDSQRPGLAEVPKTTQLIHQIWAQSVIPYSKDQLDFPLKSDSIALWVADEDQQLKRELQIYFGTVLNVKYDEIPSGVPVIIDGRTGGLLGAEFAYKFQQFNPVIWIGKPSEVINVNAAVYLLTPENNPRLDYLLSEMIYGSEGISGFNSRPVPRFLADYENTPIESQQKLGYAQAEWAGLNGLFLDSIDYLAEEMIRGYGAPGAQILVAIDGKIVHNKSYGHLTYDSLIRVNKHTIYDLASLTKVTSTLMAIMDLVDDGRINLDSTLGHYLPEYAGTNKARITLRNILSHQAGLQSYIPFWKRSLRGDMMEVFYYKSEEAQSDDRRSYGYEPHPVMRDSLESWIKNSSVLGKDNPNYLYSDIGFMILHQLVEAVVGMSIDTYLQQTFFTSAGMSYTHFNPLSRGFEIYQIAPTEYDYYFREEQVWGNVHDRNAAIFGGIAGHAGLFSNARDIALFLQMLLQGGQYGGQRYLSPGTIAAFNQSYFEGNRRGLGWDKPGKYNPNISALASPESFGHTGFTGTMIWADPEHDLVFVFLSNRIFPDSRNKNLIRLDTRRKMHDMVYRAMLDKDFVD